MIDRVHIALFSQHCFAIRCNQERPKRMAPECQGTPGDVVRPAQVPQDLLMRHRDDVDRQSIRHLLALGTAMCPTGGAFFNRAEQFIHGHGHGPHHDQARKGQAHLHG